MKSDNKYIKVNTVKRILKYFDLRKSRFCVRNFDDNYTVPECTISTSCNKCLKQYIDYNSLDRDDIYKIYKEYEEASIQANKKEKEEEYKKLVGEVIQKIEGKESKKNIKTKNISCLDCIYCKESLQGGPAHYYNNYYCYVHPIIQNLSRNRDMNILCKEFKQKTEEEK
jgi:hypothetical protein